MRESEIVNAAEVSEPFSASTPEHFKALSHPLRHRIWFELAEPATVSQLARKLGIKKGSAAHHLGVLRDAGMAVEAGTRTVRGGVEQYYRSASKRMLISERPETTTAAMRAATEELIESADEPLFNFRHVRLTAEQAEQLRVRLDQAVVELEPAAADQARYGVLVAVYRRPSDSEADAAP